MTMTPQEAAARLDGCEYRKEGSKELWAEMKAAGLVAVYGASDDLMEFDGAVSDEVGCFEGGESLFTRAGLLENECRKDDCPYFAREIEKATPVTAIWGLNGISWQYETAIPHATFKVMEDGEIYCIGIVFALADVPEAPSPVSAEVRAILEEARSGLTAYAGGEGGACRNTVARIDALLAA